MISRATSIALILAAYLMVAVTFGYFAMRMQTVHDFLIDVRDRQANIIDSHLSHQDDLMLRESKFLETHLVKQDEMLAAIKKHCDQCTHTSE